MEEHVLSLPLLRQRELAAVGTTVVVEFSDVGRFALEGRCPGVAYVAVDAVAVAVYLE